MFYKKHLRMQPKKTVQLNLTSFKNGINTQESEDIMPHTFAINTYNYNYESGALVEGIGFEDLKVPESAQDPIIENLPTLPEGKEIDCIWHFKHYNKYQQKQMDKLMLYTKDSLIYYATMFSPLPTFFLLENVNFDTRPTALNYKLNGSDVIILTSQTNSFVCWNGENVPQVVTTAPKISSLCTHRDKLFATVAGKNNIVRYSSNLDPTTWTVDVSGPNDYEIELNDERGTVNKVISFLGNIYVFRDFGITKVRTYEGVNEVDVSHLFVSGNRIYKDTICVCGDRILMLTKDGIYQFDGVTTRKIELKIGGLLEGIFNDQAVASYHAGKYYISCKLNYPDNNQIGCETNLSHINNTLIQLNVKTEMFNISRGIDVTSMTSIQVESMSKMAFCFNSVFNQRLGQITKNGMFFDQPTTKHWYTPVNSLNYPNYKKLIRQISLITAYDCNLTIITEKSQSTYYIKGKNTISSIKPNIKGELIGLKIESLTDKCQISNVKLTLQLL